MKRIIPIILLAALLLCGCFGGSLNTMIMSMNTYVSVSAWGKQNAEALQTLEKILEEVPAQWTVTEEDSVISKLNSGENVTLTAEQKAFLEQVEALSERTGGLFDPKLLKITEAWGFLSGVGVVPTQEQIDAALADKQWNLNGAVPGYVMDLYMEALDKLDVQRLVVNMGGNTMTYGSKEDGPWAIGIKDPEDGDINIGIAQIEGTMTLHTAADYLKFFEQDGKYYHHIIDPRTGKPAESDLTSVTVLCKSGLTGDVLSTALYVMGLEDAVEFWRQSDDFEVIFITKEGKILATEGVKLTQCEHEVITREQ